MNNNLGLAGAQAAQGNLAGPCRERVETIVNTQVQFHERELAGWNWLQLHLLKDKPVDIEEVALYEILSRARRETRY